MNGLQREKDVIYKPYLPAAGAGAGAGAAAALIRGCLFWSDSG